MVHWKCAQGHEYDAPGGFGPQPCPTCGADAYVVARYYCSEHGVMEARLRHELDRDGGLIVAGVCFIDDDWVNYPQEIVCPYCGRVMRPVHRTPFDQAKNQGRQP